MDWIRGQNLLCRRSFFWTSQGWRKNWYCTRSFFPLSRYHQPRSHRGSVQGDSTFSIGDVRNFFLILLILNSCLRMLARALRDPPCEMNLGKRSCQSCPKGPGSLYNGKCDVPLPVPFNPILPCAEPNRVRLCLEIPPSFCARKSANIS